MKKSTVKATKTPAVKKVIATKVPAKIVNKPALASVKKALAPAAKPAVAKPPAKPAAKPSVKPATTTTTSTTITAVLDIGFGNTLYIRGEGPGLSWEAGVALDCVSGDTWSITLPVSTKPVIYKFLINDLSWSIGADYVAKSGQKVTLTPTF